MPKRLLWLIPLLAAAAVAGVLVAPVERPAAATSSLDSARAAADAKRWEDAGSLAAAYLRDRPRDVDALLLAGEAAARLGRFDEAIRHYDAVPDSAGADGALARLCSGDVRLKLGRMSEAERDFRRAVELDPGQKRARSRLVVVLMISGRRWEAGPHLLELVRRDEGGFDDLCSLGDPARLVTNDEQLMRSRQRAPDDPLPLLGLAAGAQLKEETEQAELLLQSITEEHPQLVEAQVRLGDLLARRGEAGRFLAWHRRLPAEAELHPQLWHVRGMFAAARGETEAAARCFWEALRREPNHLGATYQLGQALVRLGRGEEARRLGERARTLQRIATLMNLLHRDPGQIELIRETFEAMRTLGRLWEARSWLQAALAVDPQAEWIETERAFYNASSTWEPTQTATDSLPAALVDCSSYPLPEWTTAAPPLAESGTVPENSAIRFEVADAGIDFRYFNSPDPSTQGVRMFEFPGGGVGAIDYDADGRPDLYFTQGCRWPVDLAQREHLDRLYRNIGGRFADSTDAAGIVEPGFGQGLACGDLDGDGFQDLYVANIGMNRLYRNNGDGTFSDGTAGSGVLEGPLAEAWTASAAMADLNGDGLPDLFDVNYLQGEELFDLICGHAGVLRACSPTAFEGQPDRLLLNRGDGTFLDVTAVARIDGPEGNGLGIVAADFDGSGRLSLFVANDAKNNHFYANVTPSPGDPPLFEEQALVNGTAYDRDGHPQACMGVAAGDADGDGRLDLFVTNYVDESNTLYRQEGDGLFVDASRGFGLTEPSFDMLGFGTQFLDADLDGREDLVVTNGHVDDFSYKGYAYRMPPQVFRNVVGRFTEVPAETAGSFFGEPKLGRGLARLDWNGDGRDEFAVSHLEDPAALLTNVTEPAGRSFSLRLVATNTARDAIGTTVTVEAAGRRFVRQLTAGDGYEASNERKLVFGLDAADEASSVTVRWPSGAMETFADLATGAEWLMIEGRSLPLRLKAVSRLPGEPPSVASRFSRRDKPGGSRVAQEGRESMRRLDDDHLEHR